MQLIDKLADGLNKIGTAGKIAIGAVFVSSLFALYSVKAYASESVPAVIQDSAAVSVQTLDYTLDSLYAELYQKVGDSFFEYAIKDFETKSKNDTPEIFIETGIQNIGNIYWQKMKSDSESYDVMSDSLAALAKIKEEYKDRLKNGEFDKVKAELKMYLEGLRGATKDIVVERFEESDNLMKTIGNISGYMDPKEVEKIYKLAAKIEFEKFFETAAIKYHSPAFFKANIMFIKTLPLPDKSKVEASLKELDEFEKAYKAKIRKDGFEKTKAEFRTIYRKAYNSLIEYGIELQTKQKTLNTN